MFEPGAIQPARFRVHLGIRADQAIEHPAEVHPAFTLEHGTNVPRPGVPEPPFLEVRVHAPVEDRFTQEGMQLIEHQGRLSVNDGPVVDPAEGLARQTDGLVQVPPGIEAVHQFVLQAVSVATSLQLLADPRQSDLQAALRMTLTHVAQFHEAVHPFVHPGVVAFVAREHALEPVVAHLVGDHVVELLGIAHVADDGDHRILHAATGADGAVHRGAAIVGVGPDPLAVPEQAFVHVFSGTAPEPGVLRGEEHLGHHPMAVLERHAVPPYQEPFVGEPGEVVHAVLAEAEHLAFVRRGRKGVRALFGARCCGPFGHEGLVILAGYGHTGGAHHVVGRHVDGHVIAAELAEELTQGQVGHRVPALLIVHRRLGVPLGDVVGLTGMSEPGEAAIGDVYPEGGADGDGLARPERLGQRHPADVLVPGVQAPDQFGGGAVPLHAEGQAVDPPEQGVGSEMQIEIAHGVELPAEGASTLVGVGPEVQPEGVQRLGRMAGIGEGRRAAQLVPAVIEPHGEHMVHLLLNAFLG